MRRTPVLSFIAAVLFILAALNEGHLNHWGTTIVLFAIGSCLVAMGVYSLRE